MIQVLFYWYGDRAAGSRSKHWAWMPQVPAVGDTVHVPLEAPDEYGNTDSENSIAMEVHRIAWTCDGTAHWHAEVYLR
ncbi:hypothetical protein SEA_PHRAPPUCCINO_15 [Mycobacterium phage Phrappuccino]|uniref:Uncharacterized protein n=1 Tax=Mycobacterium phage Phrappuccino TaxID=2591223 RepID=A0A514DDJ9_9CAUD|nr:hypothetical protein KHQ87_gp015 [Mycobacterium phage Phrappuccino]QDH91693.1 hypothetical protein SEA_PHRAPPUCCINO_15 [Mycobacterium phage Phrappuccino]QIQ63137.1 hypothetical protein SEA_SETTECANDELA_15 [Mycobacterium phage Settecandela]